jgi:peptidoglycan/xylan/chitin deacetylase (PgdA/CDA1 family)
MVSSMRRLEIGIIDNDGNKLDLLKEILNHQGIIFKEIKKFENNSDRFPCVILIENKKEDIEKAKTHCMDDNNIIIMDKVIPMELIFTALSGNLDKLYLENKLMNPQITKLELDLIERIRKCYFRLDLPLIIKWFWPNFSKACFIMSHDIDDLNIPPLDASIFKKPWYLVSYFGTRYILKIPYNNNLSEIINLERKKGIIATYYFLANYGKYQKHLPGVIQKVKKAKHEIGLHGSRHSSHNPILLAEEKKLLEEMLKKHISSGRQHGLSLIAPQTWKYYEKIGMDNDSTFSYNDAFGFRSGVCSPYHPFDVITQSRLDVLEIPLSFMDWTGFYQKFDYDNFLKIIISLEKTVEKYHGCLAMNFHNKYLDKEKYPHILKLFKNLLDYVKNNDYWVTTSTECAKWWRKREETKVDISFNHDKIICKMSQNMPLVIEEKLKGKRYIQPTKETFQIN